MAQGPEAKIKTQVKALLKKYKAYYEMPVPGGFGKSGLDFNVCYNGCWLSVETKAPGKKATPRQLKTMHDIKAAGGAVLLVDGKDSLEDLDGWLRILAGKHPSHLLQLGKADLEPVVRPDYDH